MARPLVAARPRRPHGVGATRADAKRRPHNAINCPNRAHRARVMRFFGDGTGTGIRWKQA